MGEEEDSMKKIKSTCGKYAVNLFKNGGADDDIIALAEQKTGSNASGEPRYEFWFSIGNYKSEKIAVRQSVKKMRRHGIELAMPNN